MIRVLADCGPRIGELFALRRAALDLKGGWLHVKDTAWEGQIIASSREKQRDRLVPLPPGCVELLRAAPTRIDSEWLFPAPRGGLWWVNNFYRNVWKPAKEKTGIEGSPQDFRSSWESHLRAEGIDEADLANYAGHDLSTADAHHVRSLGRSADAVRRAIG
jgi:integrase